MQPVHSVEYELTTEMATTIHRALVRREMRRGWRRDIPNLIGAAIFAILIITLGLTGLLMPGFGAGLLCVVALFIFGALYRRWSLSHAASTTVLLTLQTSDRRVRIEFADERVRLETEFFRGEGAWTELEE